ncbi:hypothetical protein BD779DRAFT_1472627 [Infundibulicybe gibba]|nr:hypothetical protein BD779DRAFT_1472627 [Infundibulicybe gibba]
MPLGSLVEPSRGETFDNIVTRPAVSILLNRENSPVVHYCSPAYLALEELAVTHELGERSYFFQWLAQVYSTEVKKIEVLAELFLRAGLWIKGTKGWLKTVKGMKQLRLDLMIYEAIMNEKIVVGKAIYIEANTGAVKRVRRSDAYDLKSEMCLPKKATAGSEVTGELWREVNRVVRDYVDQGVAEVVLGVVFIVEAYILDIECFTYFNAPPKSRTTDIMPPYEIPVDLADRCMIIKTNSYTREQGIKLVVGAGVPCAGGEKSSLLLLTPALILATFAGTRKPGRRHCGSRRVVLDAKTSVEIIKAGLGRDVVMLIKRTLHAKRGQSIRVARHGQVNAGQYALLLEDT